MTRHTAGRGALDTTQLAASVPGESRWPYGLMTVGMTLGRYTIMRPLGRGSMGYVYAARDGQLDRVIALKILSQHDESAVQMMIREAQVLARLDDPHVVKVYDAGELDGHMFIAMQLVDGDDLAARLRKSPSTAQIITWFCDAGRGLAAAHAAGLIHRDFKPGNVLIDRRGTVAVSDFGFACDVTDSTRPSSRGILIGTPIYMSPEQHNLQPATEASDQFSFCLALWEAVFRQHPFLDGDPRAMSPFAIGHQIFEGTLVPPPAQVRVPRRLVEILTRGLAHDPAARWPSMTELLDELAPVRPRPRAWRYVAAAAVAAVVAITAGLVVLQRGAVPPTCATVEADRAHAAWSPEIAHQIDAAFAKTGRSYAGRAASMVASALDAYTVHWRDLAGEVCTAEHASRHALELVARRRACLDHHLDALRGLVGALTGNVTPELVDHADRIAGTLPELGDCDGNAPTVPPHEHAAEIAKLEVDLGTADLHALVGDYARSQTEASAVLARAEVLRWPSLEARAANAIGRASVALLRPAQDELTHAAELAMAHGLDRVAASALANRLLAVRGPEDRDTVAPIVAIARAEAERTGDPQVELGTEIAEGRALVRVNDWQGAATICRTAEQAARAASDDENHLNAEDCLIEALMPLAAYAEVAPLLDRMIGERTRQFGPEHPSIADYLSARVHIAVRQGKAAEARQAAERSLVLRRKAFPPHHVKLALALSDLGEVASAEGHDDEAEKLYEQALAACDATQPVQLTTIVGLHQGIATIEAALPGPQHLAAAFAHLDAALRLLRERDPDGVELAILLIAYGQVEDNKDPAASLAKLREARAILERHHDKRAAVAAIAIAMDALHASRFAEARDGCEDVLAHADVELSIEELAITKSTLARALVGAGGDRGRIREVATEARDLFAKLGPGYAANVEEMTTLAR